MLQSSDKVRRLPLGVGQSPSLTTFSIIQGELLRKRQYQHSLILILFEFEDNTTLSSLSNYSAVLNRDYCSMNY